jgi:hypothetical protein
MTQTDPRLRIAEAPADVIARLPRIGPLMTIGKRNGVTHERIGPVEEIARQGSRLRLLGAAHDSHVDPAQIRAVVMDRSGRMQGKVYPRLDFNGADGLPVFSLVGFGGLEPFDAALDGLTLTEDPATDPRPGGAERNELSPADPGLAPFQAALAKGGAITVAYELPGFFQQWQGVVAKVSPAMGFINVMTADFHLHLLGATVGGWDAEPEGQAVTLHAQDPSGARTGLWLRAAGAATFATEALSA